MIPLNRYLKNFSYPTTQQHAFFLIKPGFLNYKNDIYDLIIKNKKLTVFSISPVKLNYVSTSELYREHKNKDFFDDLIEYISNDICYLVEIGLSNESSNLSHNDIKQAQRIFNNELKDIIRKKFGKNDMENVVHSPDVDIKEIIRQSSILRSNINI